MALCFFVSDLHGHIEQYKKLFQKILEEKPKAVFLGGDLLPSGLSSNFTGKNKIDDFLNTFLIPEFLHLKKILSDHYPRIFLILGNDDSRLMEKEVIKAQSKGIWEYIHNRKTTVNTFTIYGYALVPPTPFLAKDWEEYDVSRYVDPGCISPEEGWRSIPVPANRIRYATIQKDLEQLVGNDDLSQSIFLFHTPPYQTNLDRAALDNKKIDHVPLDLHVGSIAVRRFIEKRQPLITLHGHIHESAQLTGSWKDKMGSTFLFSAAHNGPELALVRFNSERPEESSRELF